jgi:hypothetical protein
MLSSSHNFINILVQHQPVVGGVGIDIGLTQDSNSEWLLMFDPIKTNKINYGGRKEAGQAIIYACFC